MKRLFLMAVVLAPAACAAPPAPPAPDFSAVSRVVEGSATTVMLTAYSTTLRANGTDRTRLRVALTDSLSREITSARDTVQVYLLGDGLLVDTLGAELPVAADTGGWRYAGVPLTDGAASLALRAGSVPGKIKVEARSPGRFPGGHEIHTIPSDVELMTPTADQLPLPRRTFDRMVGADISFLPEIEAGAGRFGRSFREFREAGQAVDALTLLARHGFNAIRLRVFVDPAQPAGYAPGVGYCGLDSTLSMARRIKAAGLQFLLDFHYSDYWADPQQQNKPAAWAGLAFPALTDTVRVYTRRVIETLAAQGTPPDMVQIGNEINHGLLWPDGHIGRPDQLAALLRAGVEGAAAADSTLPVMMHIALGGQNAEARFWLDNMIARGVRFDVIGLSYYPRWHGTLEDLAANVADLTGRYHKPVNVVEYSDFKQTVHEIVFALPDGLGQGAAIWEPLGWRSGLFDREGSVTGLMATYDSLHARFLAPGGARP